LGRRKKRKDILTDILNEQCTPPKSQTELHFRKKKGSKKQITLPHNDEFLNIFLSSRRKYADISKNILNENRRLLKIIIQINFIFSKRKNKTGLNYIK